jgi:hypothetical protein
MAACSVLIVQMGLGRIEVPGVMIVPTVFLVILMKKLWSTERVLGVTIENQAF